MIQIKDQEYLIQYLEGVEPLLQKESGSASFGAKMVPFLNGVDLSLLNQVLDPTCRAKCSNILHHKMTVDKMTVDEMSIDKMPCCHRNEWSWQQF